MSLGSNRTFNKPKQAGVILVAVLVVLVILMLLISSAARLLDSRLVLASEAKQLAKSIALVKSKEQELIYLIATQRHTFAGVSTGKSKNSYEVNEEGFFKYPVTGDEIRVDGFSYTENNVMFSLQNTSGLLAVNSPTQYWLKVWLSKQGYDFLYTQTLLQSLADYADADDWQRPAGAEINEYSQMNLASPSNYLLQHCGEIYNVLGWAEVAASHPNFLSNCSLRRGGRINVNAVPLSLWKELYPKSWKRLESLRNDNKWFLQQQDIINHEPSFATISDDLFAIKSGLEIRVTVQHQNLQSTLDLELGKNRKKPFTIRYR